MNALFFTSLLLSLVLFNGDGNSWRGLTPLRSSCEDVKRILKVQACELPVSHYELSDFRVSIEFQNETCNGEPRAWRVPKGTVVALTITPRIELRPAEFGLDVMKFPSRRESDVVGLSHYDDEDSGITLSIFAGFVQSVMLYPKRSDERLRCQPGSRPPDDRLFVLLGDNHALAQIWLFIQPKTKIPVRLPSYLGNEPRPLYALTQLTSDEGYQIQLVTTRDCGQGDSCRYGTLSGRSISADENKPQGQMVSLAKGLEGYFLEATCGTGCSESTITWDENGYRYVVGLKGQILETMTKVVNSTIVK